MVHKAWHCLGEVPCCFSMSSVKFQGHTAKKIVEFDPNWAFPECNSSLNLAMARQWCTKREANLRERCPINFSCDQAPLLMVFSVRPFICHTFLTMFSSFYHHGIFWSYIINDQGYANAKGQGQRSRSQRSSFRTVTAVRIHIWWWNDAYSYMLLRRGALLFLKVFRQISRSHGWL